MNQPPPSAARPRPPIPMWVALALVLLLLTLGFGIALPQFLTARNLSLLLIEYAITGILALGMLLVILPGHVDLSAGSGVGLIGGIAAVLMVRHAVPAPLAMGLALIIGLLLWRAQGWLVVRQGIPAFIVTLGGLLIGKGLFWLTIHNTTVPIASGRTDNLLSLLTTYYLPQPVSLGILFLVAAILGWLFLSDVRAEHAHRSTTGHLSLPLAELPFVGWLIIVQSLLVLILLCGQFRGVPLPLLLLGLVGSGVYVLTKHTRLGRHLYAIGGNEEAARLSGVPVARVVLAAFTILGGLVALTGFLQTAYAGASTTTVGELMELDAVAACVIGGASLRGGRGEVSGVLLGALIMVVLLNGLSLWAVPPEARLIARGLVLGLSAWLDTRLQAKGSRSA